VLRKALEQELPAIVVVNKIDRSDARPQEVVNEIYDLFIDLDAGEKQIDFPILYAVSRDGIAKRHLTDNSEDLRPLFEQILETIPAPRSLNGNKLQVLITMLDYNDYVGRIQSRFANWPGLLKAQKSPGYSHSKDLNSRPWSKWMQAIWLPLPASKAFILARQ
jgi:predicted membrane GTPase involved in stress response